MKKCDSSPRRPVWARAAWIEENYGLCRHALLDLAAAGRIRKFKTGPSKAAAVCFCVADLDEVMAGESSPPPAPPADDRPEATDEEIAEFLRAAVARTGASRRARKGARAHGVR